MTITTMLAPPMPAVPASALPRHPSRGAADTRSVR